MTRQASVKPHDEAESSTKRQPKRVQRTRGGAPWSRLAAPEAPRINTAQAARMRVPLPHILSGPVSAYVFEVPGRAHRITIFGDAHFSYDNLCEPCVREKGCATVTRFIREAATAAVRDGRTLDVFLELPYVEAGGARRRATLDKLKALMAADQRRGERTLRGALRWVQRRMTGSGAAYIGVLSQLYQEFKGMLYDDERGVKTAGDRAGVRFHYCDARYEPHVDRVLRLDAEWLQQNAGTVEDVRALLHAFLFSRDFAQDLRRALGGARAAELLVPGALSVLSEADGGAGRPVHKVAKQFLRLADGPVKDAARRYLEDRVAEVLGVLRGDVGLPDTAAAANERGTTATELPAWLRVVREVQTRTRDITYPIVMFLGVWVLLMDAYTLCRLLRFSVQRGDTQGGDSVVYVGDAHAQFYVRFFRTYLRLQPKVCQPMRAAGARADKRASSVPDIPEAVHRCVNLARPCALKP